MQKKMTVILIGVFLCLGMVLPAIAGDIDWMQSKGTEIRFLMNKHPFTSFIEPKVADSEKMTGIKVTLEVFPEDQFRNKRMIELNAGGTVDGYMIMPGQAKLHYWKAGWLKPLDAFIADASLTDAAWDVKDFFAGPMKGSSIDGQQIGIVINAEASLLSYRKDLFERLNVKVPDTMEDLLKLPGVGRKTANLVLILGFDKMGICVDTHVHRITNRWGYVKTKTPDETEMRLRKILPHRYWKRINDCLVPYGQNLCVPISPYCSRCGLVEYCDRVKVKKSR